MYTDATIAGLRPRPPGTRCLSCASVTKCESCRSSIWMIPGSVPATFMMRYLSVERAGCRNQYRIGAIEIRQDTLQIGNLREIVDDDIGAVGMAGQVILMVGFGRVERPVGLDTGDDRGCEHVRLVELCDIGF